MSNLIKFVFMFMFCATTTIGSAVSLKIRVVGKP
jgi:hypothetical protein